MIKINKLCLRNLDNKYLKKAVGHISRNVVEITIKMKTIVRKPLMIKINKLCHRNLDNKYLKKAGWHISRNVVEITIKMKTIVRKPLMIKINKLCHRNLDNKYFKKAGWHISRNIVEITIKMKTIRPKTLNDKNQQASSQKFWQLICFYTFFILLGSVWAESLYYDKLIYVLWIIFKTTCCIPKHLHITISNLLSNHS